MAEYYLISQLPSLDGMGENTPVPITEERFFELCCRFLKEKARRELEDLSLLPQRQPEKSGSKLIRAWNEGERALRLALAKCRADKLGKPFDIKNESLPAELIKLANTAVECESPLEAENFLLRQRLGFLESLRPSDNFSEEFVYYYALKLKLILRIRKFDPQKGESAYRNIYNSILDGDKTEALL
ncbi:MAG: hypothetical protein IKV97_02910 [Clostridia bacterium]|nr:hypothetical protein [Clostridia bacterium]